MLARGVKCIRSCGRLESLNKSIQYLVLWPLQLQPQKVTSGCEIKAALFSVNLRQFDRMGTF